MQLDPYLGDVTVEIAFATGPDDPAPAWVDVTDLVVAAAGIVIVRGRADEYSTVQPGTANLTFDNTTGWLTAGYVGSPWYPNVKIRRKLRVSTTLVGQPVSRRFTGYIDELPTTWPGGGDYSEVAVLAVGRFKRMGVGAAFRSAIEQEYLTDSPLAYYTLGEPADSTMAGDTSTTGNAPLAFAQLGAGGTATFGDATGPPTDSLTALALAPVNAANGRYLTGSFAGPSQYAVGQSLEVFFLTGAAAAQTMASVRYKTAYGGQVLWLGISAAGKLTGGSFGGSALVSAATVTNSITHHAAVKHTCTGGTVTITLYLDGAPVATGTYPSPNLLPFSFLQVGGGDVGGASVFAGTLAHAACYDNLALPDARVAQHYLAGTTGFAGERSDQRIARYARWAGIPAAEQVLDVGLSTSIASVDTTGQAPLAAMQNIETTESGILLIDAQGRLEFQSRTRRYNALSVLSLAGEDIDPSARFVANDAYLVNDVTATRPGGITYRAVNQASIADYGDAQPQGGALNLLTTSDNEVIDAANWKANQSATPTSRLPNLTIDILTNPAIAAAVLALDVSARITVAALPQYAPFAAGDMFIEGSTETISDTTYQFVFNTSPAGQSSVWQLDSALYSQLGVSTTLAY